MPNIMTAAEADYVAAYNEYESARVAFYAGKYSPAEFIAFRVKMDDAAKVWEDERVAA